MENNILHHAYHRFMIEVRNPKGAKGQSIVLLAIGLAFGLWLIYKAGVWLGLWPAIGG